MADDLFKDAGIRIGQLYVDRWLTAIPTRNSGKTCLSSTPSSSSCERRCPKIRFYGSPELYTARATSEQELRAAEALIIVGSVRAAVPYRRLYGRRGGPRIPDHEDPMKMQ